MYVTPIILGEQFTGRVEQRATQGCVKLGMAAKRMTGTTQVSWQNSSSGSKLHFMSRSQRDTACVYMSSCKNTDYRAARFARSYTAYAAVPTSWYIKLRIKGHVELGLHSEYSAIAIDHTRPQVSRWVMQWLCIHTQHRSKEGILELKKNEGLKKTWKSFAFKVSASTYLLYFKTSDVSPAVKC